MPVKFIAEIGSNHNQHIGRTWELVQAAKAVGADAVKFQLFDENLYAPDFLSQRAVARARALPPHYIPQIAGMCYAVGLKFHCTPFSLEAVRRLAPFVDEFKIGSYEILHHELISACADTGLPVSLSAGNASQQDLNFAIYEVKQHSMVPPFVYHCVSGYPVKPRECGLTDIATYMNWYGAAGWSDHTVRPGVIHRAVALGATRIEFHLDLSDGAGAESVHGHCWKPAQIASVISDVRDGEDAAQPVYQIILEDSDVRKWRMDREDSMRPLRQYRAELKGVR